MFKVFRIPPVVLPFFSSLKTGFHWEHGQYFAELVLVIAVAWGRRNVANLYRHLEARRNRTRYNNFFLVSRWDCQDVLRAKAYQLIASLKPRKGEVVELIIDDSKKKKHGKAMEAVTWLHDPESNRTIRGHQYVMATIRFRGYTIPFGVRLYVKKAECPELGVTFRKTTELAAELISEFEPPEGLRARVLFDSYYLCGTVVKACWAKDFHFISTLKSNRNLYKNGRKLKAGKYGKNLFRRQRGIMTLRLRRDEALTQYRYADAGWIGVSDLGKLHVIFSRKNKERNILGIVTDDPGLSAAGMIRVYNGRWSIEVFFKDTKQLLGLGQYQNGSYRAAVIHLHLVCFAYALLTHVAIQREGEKGQRKTKQAAKLSSGELQNEVRRIVWDDLVEHLKELPSGDSVVKELERLLILQ